MNKRFPSLSSLISPIAMLALTAMALSYAASADASVPSLATGGWNNAGNSAYEIPSTGEQAPSWNPSWEKSGNQKIQSLPCEQEVLSGVKTELAAQEDAAQILAQGARPGSAAWKQAVSLQGQAEAGWELLAKKLVDCGIHGVETGNGIER